LQIHTLHSYPAALLNRDESGLAKRMPFGESVRTRISSQCLKRHWRTTDDQFAIRNIANGTTAVRSRNVIDRAVFAPIRNSSQASQDVLDAVSEEFNVGVYGTKGKKETGRQPLLLGLPEVEYLREQATRICDQHPDDTEKAKSAAKEFFKQSKQNLQAFREQAKLPAGLEGALFGRMVTSDPAANIDAAVHVAHAFTVHHEESESDYFSVVDDLQQKDEDAGVAHIGDMELTAGLFYGYVVVDIPGLVSNLEGCPAENWQDADRSMAGDVVEHLTHLIATVSPGAKRGSTAPYSYADLMLVEAGARQPRSLANAFRSPITAQTHAAISGVADHLARLDSAYGRHEARRVMSVGECDIPGATRVTLNDLAAWAARIVRSGHAE
jgi:CRISPR system Cascade subunit CasC